MKTGRMSPVSPGGEKVVFKVKEIAENIKSYLCDSPENINNAISTVGSAEKTPRRLAVRSFGLASHIASQRIQIDSFMPGEIKGNKLKFYMGGELDIQGESGRKIIAEIDAKIKARLVGLLDGFSADDLFEQPPEHAVSKSWYSLDCVPTQIKPVGQNPVQNTHRKATILNVFEKIKYPDYGADIRKALADDVRRALVARGCEGDAESEADGVIEDFVNNLKVEEHLKKFAENEAVSRANIAIYMALAEQTVKVLERIRGDEDCDRALMYLQRVLWLIAAFKADAKEYPENRSPKLRIDNNLAGSGCDTFHIASPNEDGSGSYFDKLWFYNVALPVWFKYKENLFDSQDKSQRARILNIAIRVGGLNPRTGENAVVEKLENIKKTIEKKDGRDKRMAMDAIAKMIFLIYPLIDEPPDVDKDGINIPQIAANEFANYYDNNGALKKESKRELNDKRVRIVRGMMKAWKNIGAADMREIKQNVYLSVRKTIIDWDAFRSGGEDLTPRNEASWWRHISVDTMPERGGERGIDPAGTLFELKADCVPHYSYLSSHNGASIKAFSARRSLQKIMKLLLFDPQCFEGKANTDPLKKLAQELQGGILFVSGATKAMAGLKANRPGERKMAAVFFAEAFFFSRVLRILFSELADKTDSMDGSPDKINAVIYRISSRSGEPESHLYAIAHALEISTGDVANIHQQGVDAGGYIEKPEAQKYKDPSIKGALYRCLPLARNRWGANSQEQGRGKNCPAAIIHAENFPAVTAYSNTSANICKYLTVATIYTQKEVDNNSQVWFQQIGRVCRVADGASPLAENSAVYDAIDRVALGGAQRVVILFRHFGQSSLWQSASEKIDDFFVRDITGVLKRSVNRKIGVAIPMMYSHHLLIPSDGAKNKLYTVSGVGNFLQDENLGESIKNDGGVKSLPCHAIATMRLVLGAKDDNKHCGLMVYRFMDIGLKELAGEYEDARHHAVTPYGWVFDLLLAAHTYNFERLIPTPNGECLAKYAMPFAVIDPWGTNSVGARGSLSYTFDKHSFEISIPAALSSISSMMTIKPEKEEKNGGAE